MDAPSGRQPSFTFRVLRGASIVIGLLLLVMLLGQAVHALLLTFTAVLLAIVLRAPADWLTARTGLGEYWSLTLVIVALLLLVGGVAALAAPQVGEQMGQLRQQLPEAIGAFFQWLEKQPWGQWLLDLAPTAQEMREGELGALLGRATGIASMAVNIFFAVFIVAFITLYLAIDPRMYVNGVLHLFPLGQRYRAAEVLAATGSTLRWWLIGTLIRMVLVGLMTFIGLWLLDVPLAFILAVLAGLLDFVPYFGPIVAGVPAVLLAFASGPDQGLYVLALYVVVQQVESLIVSPLVYHRTVYLPPVLTIIAQVLLFSMAGIFGGILATPLVTVALVLVKMLYVEQVLGDFAIDRPEDQVEPGTIPMIGDPGGGDDRSERDRGINGREG